MSADLKFSLGRLVSVTAGGDEIGRGLLRWDALYSRYNVGDLKFYFRDVLRFDETTRIITLKNPPTGGAKWTFAQ